MPYIKREDRKGYDYYIDKISEEFIVNDYQVGHMVYVIYRLILKWWDSFPRFATINSIRGVLNSVSVEFDRRVAAEYEEDKIVENGDVYSEEEDTSSH